MTIPDKTYAVERRLNLLAAWSDSLGINRYTDAAGVTWATGQRALYLTGAQTISSGSVAAVPGLTIPVLSGFACDFHGMIRMRQGVTNNIQDNIGIAGPATSYNVWFYQGNNISGNAGGGTVPTGWTVATFAGLVGFGTTLDANKEGYLAFMGSAAFSAGGNFGIYASISTTNFLLQPGTFISIRPT